MLILEPDIRIDWGKEQLLAHSYLYMDNTSLPKYRGMTVNGDRPLPVIVTVTGKDNPTVEIDNRRVLECLGAIEAIDKWVSTHNLVTVWQEEVALYLRLRHSVHLPGYAEIKPNTYVPGKSRLYLQYCLSYP